MRSLKKWVIGVGVLVAASAAQANLIVNSIDLAMVKTGFNSRDIPDFISDEVAYGVSGLGFLSAWANPANRICEKSLTAFDGISASATCGGSNQDIGTLFAIHGSATDAVELQLGLDWGRGGFTMLALAGESADIERHNSDIWWSLDWNHGDVLDFFIPQTTDFWLVGLGFEGCCDGFNSARWRSAGLGQASLDGAQWQTLAVNSAAAAAVPAPGVLGLLATGLLGIMAFRRREQNA